MAKPWFRMYSEFATDPKVQMLSEKDQRRYLMLLCLRCSNDDVTLHETEVAFQLRISDDELATTKVALMAKGLINEDFSPVAWEKRQYVSDSSTKRVAASRARKKQAVKPPCNVTVTPPDTDTDTDITPSLPADAPATSEFDPARLVTMHLDWLPDPKILAAYAKRAGIALENFTAEAIGQFAVYHTARQALKSQAEHVAALVGWVKRDAVHAAKVVPMAGRRAASGDFDDNATGWLGE